MHLFVVGLNHHTAPIEVRERLTISDHKLREALESLISRPGISEGAILSTCNRTEVYGATERSDDSQLFSEFLADYHQLHANEFASYLYRLVDLDAISHLFRVASGLDSLVLGEPQILGQVRTSYSAAVEAGAAGTLLNSLFQSALATGKRARTETDIGRGGFSVGHAAVDLARSIFGSLAGAGILILGAGKMSELTAKHLVASGIKMVVVANRTYEKAVSMAERFGGRAIRYDEFSEALVTADIVISSTASQHHVLTRTTLLPVLRRRRGKPLFLVDIAVPRDIEPEVAGLDNVFLYDLDDLQEVVSDMARERASETERVNAIIAEEATKFVQWWRSLHAVPVLTQLKEKHEEIRQSELRRLRNQLPNLPEDAWDRIEAATRSMMNRVARDPIARIKAASHESPAPNAPNLVEAAKHIFALNGQAPDTPSGPLVTDAANAPDDTTLSRAGIGQDEQEGDR